MPNSLSIQTTSPEVEIRSRSAESIVIHRVFGELKNRQIICKTSLTSCCDFQVSRSAADGFCGVTVTR